MRNPFPRRNLPPESEPWGREHDERVRGLSASVDRLSQEVLSLRAQTQALSRVTSTVPVFRYAHASTQGDFTIPSNDYTTILSGSFLAPRGMSRGIITAHSTVVKTPDTTAVTDNWIATAVVVSSGADFFALPGENYFGYRDPSSYARDVSIISSAREFEFESSGSEYEIQFELKAARGASNYNNTNPVDVASVNIVALFYGEITPEDTV